MNEWIPREYLGKEKGAGEADSRVVRREKETTTHTHCRSNRRFQSSFSLLLSVPLSSLPVSLPLSVSSVLSSPSSSFLIPLECLYCVLGVCLCNKTLQRECEEEKRGTHNNSIFCRLAISQYHYRHLPLLPVLLLLLDVIWWIFLSSLPEFWVVEVTVITVCVFYLPPLCSHTQSELVINKISYKYNDVKSCWYYYCCSFFFCC